jgi:pyruvate dehydrogenase complex dehydrogenase (E1) component
VDQFLEEETHLKSYLLPNESAFVKLYEGTGERKISTTMAAVRVLTDLTKR